MTGAEIVGPPATRLVYKLLQAGGSANPLYRFRWTCPACGSLVDESEEKSAERRANEHQCEFGWCAVPITAERLAAAECGPRFDFTVTPQNREEWARQRRRNAELARLAKQTADRVVPPPRSSEVA